MCTNVIFKTLSCKWWTGSINHDRLTAKQGGDNPQSAYGFWDVWNVLGKSLVLPSEWPVFNTKWSHMQYLVNAPKVKLITTFAIDISYYPWVIFLSMSFHTKQFWSLVMKTRHWAILFMIKVAEHLQQWHVSIRLLEFYRNSTIHCI